MSNKNVTLKEKVNGVLGDTIFPATITPNVYDSAKGQALSQTLVNTPDYEALGFAKFSTASAYSVGDKVYKDNELYRFIADKAAGEWDVAKVEPWSIEQEIEEVDDAIRSLIPAQASADNKLADKAYVNDKVSTDTATFRGTFNLVSDLHLTTSATQGQIATALGTAISGEDKNDYAFVQIPTSDATPTEIARIDRYKYTGLQWAFEYSLNNSGFTAEQWAAINSGITSSLVTAFGAKYDKPSGGIPKTDLAEGVQTSLNKADSALQPEVADEAYAKKDGYYSQMTVGSAENLVGQTVDKDAYLIRPTATSDEATNEVANGVASVLAMEGNSCVWNQMFTGNISTQTSRGVTFTKNSDGSYTINGTATGGTAVAFNSHSFIRDRYYYIPTKWESEGIELSANTSGWSSIKKGVFKVTSQTNFVIGVAEGVTVDNIKVYPIIIDLTSLGIDNLTTTDQVEAWLAKHVGTKPYYAYNAGTILSAQTLGIKTYGQNLLNTTTRQAKLIPYTWEENSNVYTIKNVPSANDLQITYTPDATGVAVTIDTTESIPDSINISDYGGSGVLYISSATADTYVCMKWDEQKDNDVVPYEDHTYDFDVRKVYGKVSGAGDYVQCYPNGMRSAGSVHDTLSASEAIVNIGSVDLGRDVLSWEYISPDNYVRISNTIIGIRKQTIAISTKYIYGGQSSSAISNGQFYVGNTYFGIKDSSISAEDVVNRTIAKLNDVELVYQLATPITYTDLVYRDNDVDTPLSDVLLNITVNNWSMEEQLMTAYVDGNPTSIPATISTIYGMDAVEQIDTLNKTCYFADDVKANLQALLTCINTNCAETLGGTFSIGDPTQEDSKVFTFTFTPNTEPDVEPTNEGE